MIAIVWSDYEGTKLRRCKDRAEAEAFLAEAQANIDRGGMYVPKIEGVFEGVERGYSVVNVAREVTLTEQVNR